ncbi:MAG: efflux transporter outer membrane subunit [Desulfobacterium sp.]
MLIRFLKNILICMVAQFLFLGCQQFTPASRHLETQPLSGKSTVPYLASPTVSSKWWEQFNNNELNTLIETALADNFSIREAWARLDLARAATTSRNSALFPTITMDGGYTRTQAKKNISSYNTFSTGPSASYEVDLWGRIKANIAASQLETKASRYDLETAAMSVAAQVADTWVELIANRKQLALAKQQLTLNTTVLDLLELRFENSMSTALDVLQQREVVASAKAAIPPIENQITARSNALALLLGKTPDKAPIVQGDLPDQLPALPVKGIPANLLALRPDVRAAGSRLLAADWYETHARTNRLPDFSLTGSVLFREGTLDLLLQNWILSLGAGLSATVFDGGKKDAAVEQAMAVVKERLASYEKTVTTAIVEVESSMAAEQYQTRYVDLLLAELDSARQARQEAGRRYIKGLDPFIPFLTEQVNVQKLESRLIEQKAVLIKNRIALYRALGGDWTQNMEIP